VSGEYVIGVDFGTSATKVVALDRSGESLIEIQRPTSATLIDGREYHEPQRVWKTVAELLRELRAALRGGEPVGLGVAGVGEEGVLIDDDGTPLGPALAWYDRSTEQQCEVVAAVLDPRRLHQQTGLPLRYQFSLCKWLWHEQREPGILARASAWLSIPDYLAFCLCGERGCAESEACRTMAYDIHERRWDPEILGALGLPSGFLPPVRLTNQVTRVTSEASVATALPGGLPVVVGGHDHIVGALGVGGCKPGRVVDSCGSAETIVWPVEEVTVGAQAYEHEVEVGRYGWGDLYYASIAIYSGRFLAWAKELLGSWSEEEMRRVPVGARGVEVRIDWRSMEARIAGLGLQTGAAEIGRAMVEGLNHEFREALERVQTALDIPEPSEIVVVGGLSRSDLWLETKSAVLGRRLLVPRDAEATARGAALLAADAVGFGDVNEIVAHSGAKDRVIEPVLLDQSDGTG